MSTTIELSFGTGKGGAWDDRELIRASEAAMKEFHIHHPGPGSWLDKATAALAAGRKLPGAEDYGTAWYSASLPSEGESSINPTASASASAPLQDAAQAQNQNKKRKSRQSNGTSSHSHSSGTTPNPYAPSAQVQSQIHSTSKKQRFASPSYQPPSPGAERDGVDEEDDEDEEYVDEEDEEDEEEEEYDEQAEWGEADWEVEDYYPDPEDGYDQILQGQGGYDAGYYQGGGEEMYGGPSGNYGSHQMAGAPSVGLQQSAGVGREEALSYAMTAQYWAGYWMGVAQGSRQTDTRDTSRHRQSGRRKKETGAVSAEDRNMGAGGAAGATTSGLGRGRKSHNEPARNGAGQSIAGEKEISNVFVTQKRFNRPAIDGLRR
ncbi:hypothetical protein IAT40_005027 [Kwoniella sp. CBS 6097]